MARKITEEACKAFNNGYKFKRSNTEVYQPFNAEGCWFMSLHGNNIAKRENGSVYIKSGGWRTSTTKERLNGLSGVNIYQFKFQWYLNGEPWIFDNDWTKV